MQKKKVISLKELDRIDNQTYKYHSFVHLLLTLLKS